MPAKAVYFVSLKQLASNGAEKDHEVWISTYFLSDQQSRLKALIDANRIPDEDDARKMLFQIEAHGKMFLRADLNSADDAHSLQLMSGNNRPVHVYVLVRKRSAQGPNEWVSATAIEFDANLKQVATEDGWIVSLSSGVHFQEDKVQNENEVAAVEAKEAEKKKQEANKLAQQKAEEMQRKALEEMRANVKRWIEKNNKTATKPFWQRSRS